MVRTHLKRRNSLSDYFSGNTELGKVLRPTCSSHTSYDDIRYSFLKESSEYKREVDISLLLAWCSNFNAGSIDSIAHLLPPRSVESSQAGEEHRTNAYRQARKRWRDLSRMVNSIVYRIPGEPRIVYIALGGMRMLRLVEKLYSLVSSQKLPIFAPNCAYQHPGRHDCFHRGQEFEEGRLGHSRQPTTDIRSCSSYK